MTINISQGQSLDVVGVWLEEPVFIHGYNYMLQHPGRNPSNIRFATLPIPGFPFNSTKNIVYREVLLNF